MRAVCVLGITVATLASVVSARADLVEGNIETDIRPMVHLRYSGAVGTPEQRTVVGIFDTGDPADTLSRETAALLGLTPITPLNPNPSPPIGSGLQNQGTTAALTITAGGLLGAILNGPEQTIVGVGAFPDPQVRVGVADPAHVFSFATTTRTDAVSSTGIHPWYLDYNEFFSETHVGQSFVTGADPSQNLAAFVDPTNAVLLPFAYTEINGPDGSGNGRELLAPFLPIDQLGSSVSFFANDDDRVPQPEFNENPGFVHFFPIAPAVFPSTLTPAPFPSPPVVNPALPVERRLTFEILDTDAPNLAGLIPLNGPFYLPGDAGGNILSGILSGSFEVDSASVAKGGQEDPAGFVREDGTVQVIVKGVPSGNELLNQTIRLPSQGPVPFGTINIPALGINTGPIPVLIDTGAPTTGPSIIGTDILNQFGQFFDFSPSGDDPAHPNRGRLTLIGPTDPEVRALRANGILFSVDYDTMGLSRTAVDQEKVHGFIPIINNFLGGATEVDLPISSEAHGTVFSTKLTGSNAAFIDEGAIGLTPGDQDLNALSLGADVIRDIYFSVGRVSQGLMGSEVFGQHSKGQEAGDIFRVFAKDLNTQRVPQLSNELFINQEVMGLGPNYGPAFSAGSPFDDLNALDLGTGAALPADALSNLDPIILTKDDAGSAQRPRLGSERLAENFDLYFSIEDSPSIFLSDLSTIFADETDIGLGPLDDLDALALFRPSVLSGFPGLGLDVGLAALSPDLEGGVFDPNPAGLFLGIDSFQGLDASDLALFSLSIDSLSLLTFGLSPSDIFITDFDGSFTLFATASSLGLTFNDNLNALDAVPEPGTLVLLLLGTLGLVLRRRRT